MVGFSSWYLHIRRRSLSVKVFLEVDRTGVDRAGGGLGAEVASRGDSCVTGASGRGCNGNAVGGLLLDGGEGLVS